ncbi:hypothetical protein RCH14_004564 [Massilia sp. MP_M2]
MIGCCGCEMEKFRASSNQTKRSRLDTFRALLSGSSDDSRLGAVVERLTGEGWTEEQIARVKACKCDCHVDGQAVLC